MHSLQEQLRPEIHLKFCSNNSALFNASAVSAINRMDDLNAAMVSSISGKGLGVDFETDEETGLTTLTGGHCQCDGCL